MAKLKNHPGFWLRDDAAAQFDLLEQDHGVMIVNSAGRTVAEQNELIRRWNAGGKYNRPPYLYEPARPATASNHVANGGIAVDTSSIAHMLRYGEAYGFYRPHGWDKPHFEFDPRRVKVRPAPAGKPAAPKPSTPTTEQEDEEMIIIVQRADSALAKARYNPATGRTREITRSENNLFRQLEKQEPTAVEYVTVTDADYAKLLKGQK